MKAAIALAICLAATGVHAEFTTGNRLYADMTGPVTSQVSAQGYVTGVADAIAGVYWCPNEYVTVQQVYDLTLKALASLPQHRDKPAAIFVRVALAAVFPCPTSKPGLRGAL